jgi:hypothetical protein
MFTGWIIFDLGTYLPETTSVIQHAKPLMISAANDLSLPHESGIWNIHTRSKRPLYKFNQLHSRQYQVLQLDNFLLQSRGCLVALCKENAPFDMDKIAYQN